MVSEQSNPHRSVQCPAVTAYNHLLLDNQLCFALYAATNAVTRAYREPLSKLGLTYPQYLAMLVLWEHGAQTVKGLADALQLDSSTLTPLLKRLETAGWVSRARDAGDERIVRIELSAAGKALRRPVSAIQKVVVCRTQLPQAEFVVLRSLLHELAETMANKQVQAQVQVQVQVR